MPNLIKRDTHALALPFGRIPGSRGHQAAAKYITEQFTSIELAPYRDQYLLPYTAYRTPLGTRMRRGYAMNNIAAHHPGTNPELPPIIIGAHYDSAIDAPSADDNAASVAAILYIAERLTTTQQQHDIIFVMFDGNEPPYFRTEDMGSTQFVEQYFQETKIHTAIILDHIGHPVQIPGTDPNLTLLTGLEGKPTFPNLLQAATIPILPIQNARTGDISDYHRFRRKGHPFLFFTSGEWPDHHTRRDTPDKVDYPKVTAIAEEILRMIPLLDHMPSGPIEPIDITTIEEQAVLQHLGEPLYALIGGTIEAVIRAIRNGTHFS